MQAKTHCATQDRTAGTGYSRTHVPETEKESRHAPSLDGHIRVHQLLTLLCPSSFCHGHRSFKSKNSNNKNNDNNNNNTECQR